MENTNGIHFYPSKVKNVLLLTMCLLFFALGVLVVIGALTEDDIGIVVLGIALAIIFGILFVFGLKRVWNPGPYLMLTSDELIINASNKNAIHIKWVDIRGFNTFKSQNNKFVGVILYDPDKYREQMSSKMRKLYAMNTMMNMPLYNIAYGQIRRPDRKVLWEELENHLRNRNKAE